MNLADTKFQTLQDMEKPLPPLTCTHRPQWMLAGSLQMIEDRADHRRRPDNNHNMARALTRAVQKSLVMDICHRAEVAAEDIGACLESPRVTP